VNQAVHESRAALQPRSGPEPAVRAGAPALRIEVVTSEAGWLGLAIAWRALELRCANASVFLTWDWQWLWWQSYGRLCRGTPCVLVARSGDEVVGVLPLYVQRQRSLGVLPIRLLRMVGTGGDTSPDDLGPMVADEHLGEVSRAFARHIVHGLGGWNRLQLSDLRPRTEFVQALQQNAAAAGLVVHESESARIPWGPLPATWADYLASLSSNRRQQLRQRRRRFEKLEGARFRVCSDDGELDAVFARLADLHRRRWQSRTERHAFSTPAYMAFHGELVRALNARGRLRLFALEAEGEMIAVLYCMRFRDELLYFQGGFDPQRADVSPGQVLMGHAIEAAIAEGCTVFDMLKGDYDHKRHFFAESRATVEIDASQPGWPSWAWRLKGALARLRQVVAGEAV
jgi:CelD/BcsL family acetyltransferase involved in cellulose biosynthesis